MCSKAFAIRAYYSWQMTIQIPLRPNEDEVDSGCLDGGQDEEVKHMTASLPYRGVAVLLLTLFVETVDLCNLP